MADAISKIIYMGTPEFALVPLEKLTESGRKPILVITQPDRPGNRGKVEFSPVKEFALREGIEILQPEKVKGNAELMERVRELNPDIIVVAAYGKILPKEFLDIPRLGCINIHGSILPRHRGASPIQRAIAEGDDVTGVTIMQMDEGMDTGDIIAIAETEIGGLNYPELMEKLAKLGGDLLLDTLSKIESGEVERIPQSDELATYTGIISKTDGKIDFSERAACEVERLMRAYEPWPGVYAMWNGDKLKLISGEVLPAEENPVAASDAPGAKPGTVIRAGEEGIDIICREGVLRVTAVQAPGKRRMAVSDFLRGNRLQAGDVLE